ncbi:hypothetical protein QR685DRAFT_574417 [Neurospora intermedia]|uniref:Uncharacterized protein n=1 Tax=Neurospora intermedia TaxID=5142 RepID=A0ABR3D4J4_NEUIN
MEGSMEEKEKRQRSNLDDEKMREADLGPFGHWTTVRLYGNGKIANTYCIIWRKGRLVISVLDIVDLVVVLSSVWTVDADDDFLPLPAGLFTFSTGQSGEEPNLQWVPGQFEAVPAPGPWDLGMES